MADTRKRMSIDFSDLFEEIEAFRDDEAWKELNFTQKVKVLLRERLASAASPDKQKGSK